MGIINRIYGTNTAATITTGGASQVLAGAQPGRSYIRIQNTSDTIMYVNFGAAASATVGIPIAANGGVYEEPNASQTVHANSINVFGTITAKTFTHQIY